MKITTILLLATSLHLSAKGISQSVTISSEKITLIQAFEKIGAQTGYSFFWNQQQMEKEPPIQLNIKNATLKQALDNCLSGLPYTYVIKDRLIYIKQKEIHTNSTKITTNLSPQPITIRGRVTDSLGQPIAGVSIKILDSKTGTFTDKNGQYQIKGEPGDKLEFTFVGFKTKQISIENSNPINVQLESEVNALEDIVMVGYGTQKKEDVTGAISVVTKEQLENRPVTNTLAALQGAAPGLVVTRSTGQPGKEGWSAQIRGVSSVNGSSPLILVDGVEQASIGSLDQNDIESVSILKDASAAAIYGARGANGVILITTKRGVAGKVTVKYSGNYAVNHAYNMPKKMHSWQEAEMLNQAAKNAGGNAVWTDEQIGWMKDPNMNYRIKPTDTTTFEYYYDTNMIDSVVKNNKNTTQYQQNLSVSGGNDKTQYLFSLGWYGQDGLFKFGPDNYNRYNARLNLTTKFTNWLSLDSRIAYTNSEILSPSTGVDGDYGLLYNIYVLRALYPVHVPGTNYYAVGNSTTYAQLKEGGKTDERTDNFSGVFTLQSNNVVKGLSLKAIYAPYLQSYNDNVTKRLIPLYNRFGPSSSYLNNPNSYSVVKSNVYRSNYQFLADYDWHLGSQNNFHILGGYQVEEYRSTSSTAVARNLSSNDLFSLNLGDPTLYTASDGINTWATESMFGRLNYNYGNKYFVEGTVRRDGSSKLAPGYRYNTFPSVSVGWRLNKENWFNNALPFFDEFKLRGSYGKLGNSDLSNFGSYDYIATLSSNVYPFNNQSTKGYYEGTLASPLKTWENILTSNIGLDMILFNNRLTLNADYYQRKNTNMLVKVNTTAMIGIGTSQYNYASMKSWGWELNIAWKDKIGDNFNYWFNGNISNSDNKVLSYQGSSVYSGGVNGIIEGQEINTIWGYQALGLYKSDQEVTDRGVFQSSVTGAGDIIYDDIDGSKTIDGGKNSKDDHGDLVKLGSTTPHYVFGFNLGFSYKNIDFSAFFQGVGQRKMLINSYFMLPFVESWRQPVQGMEDYWTPENLNARYPRLYLGGGQNTSTSSWWVQDASYIRLKNLQIGYTLPRIFTQKAGMSAVRVYFSGQDLWEKSGMWMKYYDAEQPNNTTFSYPFFRSYSLGLNITF